MTGREDFLAHLKDRASRAGVPLRPEDTERFFTYYELLRQWNRTINLTALPLAGFPPESLDRLFIEPLVASQVVDDVPLRWVDVGSGGGSPAVPLKIVRPRLRLTLTEPKERKAAFLREVIRGLHLSDSDVQTTRVERLVETLRNSLDLITVRAVRLDARLLEAVRACLKKDGRCLAFGSRLQGELEGFRLLDDGRLGPPGDPVTNRVHVYGPA